MSLTAENTLKIVEAHPLRRRPMLVGVLAATLVFCMLLLGWTHHSSGHNGVYMTGSVDPQYARTITDHEHTDDPKKLRNNSNQGAEKQCLKLRYIEDKSSPVTALASFPGSGNTWMLYLLQLATGTTTTTDLYI